MRSALLPLLALAILATTGCTSVRASVVRTGPLHLPPHVGAVAIFAAGTRPAAAQDLGIVEVHAAQNEATLETLMPIFVQKVAQVGGDAAVIDAVVATFELVSHPHVETYTYPCGYHATCTGTRMYQVNDEVMTVSMRGHAMSLPGASP